MIKKNIGIAALTLVFATIFGTIPVHAVEVEEIDCVADPTNAACIVTTSDEDAVMPIDEPTDSDAPVRDHDYPEADNTAADDEESAEEGEPTLWPMYLSLGALALAVIVFIILNLFGNKKRR